MVYMSEPQNKIVITHGGSDYPFENETLNFQNARRENGWDIADFTLPNDFSAIYKTKIAQFDAVKIYVKDYSDGAWTTLLNGVIDVPLPSMPHFNLRVKCNGSGWGLNRMLVAAHYGTQSELPSLDTIKEILTDSADGIIPEYVNDILNTGASSGFNYSTTQSVANDLIEDIAGSLFYLYFPYKPADKTINDLCELLQAIKGTNAGAHWIVTTDNKIILSTIGNHHAAAVTAGWTNYYGGSQANATFTQGIDFETYNFQQLEKEANYVLYYGKYRFPASEVLTEANASSWGKLVNPDPAQGGVVNDGSSYVLGLYSLCGYTYNTASAWIKFFYPSTARVPSGLMNFDVTKIGGKFNIPTISFYCMVDAHATLSAGVLPSLLLGQGDLDDQKGFIYTFGGFLTANKWAHVTLPIGRYAKNYPYLGDDLIASPQFGADLDDWSQIDYVQFATQNNDGTATYMWIDDLRINGWITRVAKQSAAYSSTDPCLMKIISDDLAKDDSLDETVDAGTIARLAYAEYLRSISTPEIGSFTIPMVKDLWPGMLVHVHAEKKADGNFNINQDMRVTQLTHDMSIGGYHTTLMVTSDVKNSHARMAFDDFNKVAGSIRPEFQDAQATSIKMREIDITQQRLVKSY